METFSQFLFKESVYNEGINRYLGAAALATTLLTSPVKGNEVNKPSIQNTNQSQLIQKIADYISQSEGIKSQVYTDTKGHKTIGIGHKLTDSDKDLFIKLFNGTLDYNSIYNGTQSLNKTQIYKLFSYDLNKKLQVAYKLYPKFTNFSDNMKCALIDSIFRGESHPKTDNLINLGNFKDAAIEYLNNEEFKKSKSGVNVRMIRNAKNIDSNLQ